MDNIRLGVKDMLKQCPVFIVFCMLLFIISIIVASASLPLEKSFEIITLKPKVQVRYNLVPTSYDALDEGVVDELDAFLKKGAIRPFIQTH